MKTRPLRIGIDARAAAHPQPGGFKTYVKNLIAGLSTIDGPIEFRLYVDRPLEGPRLDDRFAIEMVPTPAIPMVGAAWREQVALPAHVLFHGVDAVHLPSGTGSVWTRVPTVVTIHDAIEQMPVAITGAATTASGTRRHLIRIYNSLSQRISARRAAIVITDSESSRRDILRYLGIPDWKIRVVPAAPAPLFRKLPDTSSPAEPFILMIASADPRKNLVALLRAYAALPPDLIASFRLVLVWTHHLLQEQLLREAANQGIAGRITSITRPTDDELCRLYNQAAVFVFPSFYEGFGLPPLEAMACGTPVISSRASSLPEILGSSALLVDPRSEAELTRALVVVLSDGRLRRELSQRGLAHARHFSWERTAVETLAIYRDVATAATIAGNHLGEIAH